MTSRARYWTCSSFADWLRGTPKPNSGTSKEWRLWNRASKEAHPFRYWLAEEGLDYIQDFVNYVPDKINSVRYYLNNRFIVKTHALTAHPRDLPRGQWRDVGNRFLPCLFNELVNFIEVEKAWMMVCWGDEETRKKYELPYWRKQWYTRWFMEWRNPQAGLDYLDWEASLTFNDDWIEKDDPKYGLPTYQAERAKEVKALYLWWTVERPKRVDPYDESGWTALCEKRRSETGDVLSILNEDRTPAEEAESRAVLDTLHALDAKYDQEDEDMMIRLIKARESLWT